MHPIVFHLGQIPIYSYGLLIAIAILLGTFWAYKRGTAHGIHDDSVMNTVLCLIIGGFLGARLLYVAYFPAVYLHHPLMILTDRGGLVWYGGLFGGILASTAYYVFKKVPLKLSVLADILILPAALGLALGRIGCFLTGCCYGIPCKLPWAVRFPYGHPSYPHSVHPAQLYESVSVAALLLLLLWIENKQNYKSGTVFSLFMIGYGIIRFAVETVRGDALLIMGLSSSQWFSLFSIISGLVLMRLIRNKSQQTLFLK